MDKLRALTFWRESRDYLMITVGLVIYAVAWTTFLLPYQITTGGLTGVSAIIFYATGIKMEVSYFFFNVVLLVFALRLLGLKFCLKTIYAVFMLTFLLWFFQELLKDDAGNARQILGAGQDFMACVVGACLCGLGVGIVFSHNGSTGGTDIIAAAVNKYRDISIGRMMMYLDILIISSCYFIFHDWRRMVFGFVVLVIMSIIMDYIINSSRQSVQFFIFSEKYDEIASAINRNVHRGVTLLDATGWYSKQPTKVIIVMARRSQSVYIFRLINDIDPNAFVSQSNVVGVYGQGFDRIKVK